MGLTAAAAATVGSSQTPSVARTLAEKRPRSPRVTAAAAARCEVAQSKPSPQADRVRSKSPRYPAKGCSLVVKQCPETSAHSAVRHDVYSPQVKPTLDIDSLISPRCPRGETVPRPADSLDGCCSRARRCVPTTSAEAKQQQPSDWMYVCMIDLANALPAETHWMRSLGERGEGGGGGNEPKVLLYEEGKVPCGC